MDYCCSSVPLSSSSRLQLKVRIVLFVVSSRRVDCSHFNCDATDVLTSNLDNKDGRWMTVGVVLHLLLSFFEKRRAPAP